ncbi:hypothetical protein J7E62_18315, partial [Variovorax paradoxus]|nr:hypothetical protein [Variovorax paradoxus]
MRNTTINNNGVGVGVQEPADGLDIDGSRNVVRIEHVTFSANTEEGLEVEGPGNQVTVSHSTIAGNGSNGILYQDVTSSSIVVVYNSIVAGNVGADAQGNIRSAGYNLVGNGSSSTGFNHRAVSRAKC